MNKSELIDAIASHAQLNKAEAGRALDGLIKTIGSSLKSGEPVMPVGFGSFQIIGRAERKGRNPQTGEEITIAAAKLPGFKAGKALKVAVNT